MIIDAIHNYNKTPQTLPLFNREEDDICIDCFM